MTSRYVIRGEGRWGKGGGAHRHFASVRFRLYRSFRRKRCGFGNYLRGVGRPGHKDKGQMSARLGLTGSTFRERRRSLGPEFLFRV